MKSVLLLLCLLMSVRATVIDVVTIHQPLSLHGSDVDDEVDDTGESLQAAIHARPMALTGGFPEVLVEAIAMPHQLPTNNPNYAIKEVNLVVLCGLKVAAEMADSGELQVEINLANFAIPDGVDLTARQVLKLVCGSIRKTLGDYNADQKDDLKITLRVVGTNESNRSLEDLGAQYKIPGKGA
ncbi:MAG: hypothetical protein RI957_683 [Verrucomicrobiota bacterium]|jgi:hypothetical protein